MRLAWFGLVLVPSVVALWACERLAPPANVLDRLKRIDRPNIVLILVDTLRADWTSPYGFDAEVSPELQRWADRGVVFERALAQSSWTKVSMASLLTSLWPRSHGVRLPTDGLSEGALTDVETCFAGPAIVSPKQTPRGSSSMEDDLPHALVHRDERSCAWRSRPRRER